MWTGGKHHDIRYSFYGLHPAVPESWIVSCTGPMPRKNALLLHHRNTTLFFIRCSDWPLPMHCGRGRSAFQVSRLLWNWTDFPAFQQVVSWVSGCALSWSAYRQINADDVDLAYVCSVSRIVSCFICLVCWLARPFSPHWFAFVWFVLFVQFVNGFHWIMALENFIKHFT